MKGKVYRMFIQSARWKRLRDEFITEHPFCQMCEKKKLITPSTCVHHIEPAESAYNIAEIEALMFNKSNLMSLCQRCHHDIHNAEGYHKKDKVKERKALKINVILSNMYGADEDGPGI